MPVAEFQDLGEPAPQESDTDGREWGALLHGPGSPLPAPLPSSLCKWDGSQDDAKRGSPGPQQP